MRTSLNTAVSFERSGGSMLFAPKQIGRNSLSPDHLKADKSACKKIGPCGLGREAMYLNSFFIDRYYYVKYIDVSRVFKRVAMSRGGFSGKGVFGSIPYLVVQLKNGSERACNFKYEDDVDRFLQEISRSHPEIPALSREGEKKIAEARAKEEARYVKNLTPEAEASIAELLRAKEILSEDSGKSARLSYSAKQKRTIDLINPTYRYAALAIFLLAAAACVFGVITVFQHKGYSAYFILFGAAFMLFAMSTRVMPTGKNNRRAAQREWDKALYDMQGFVSEHKEIPVPAQYAHPATIDRMIRVIREGKAESVGKAYEVMKEELRAINNQVTVSQTEYDEIVAIKPMFLLCGYRDDLAETA